MGEKCFTIETRLGAGQFPQEYFVWDIMKQNRVFRIVWKLIQENRYSQSKLNTYLQHTYHIDKRTANTLIQTAKGRLKALKELKKVERADLAVKISGTEKEIEKIKSAVNELKSRVTENKATEKQLMHYRRFKRDLWQKKQKLNRMKQQLAQYDHQDESICYPVCWGSKKLFKGQYYLKENAFRSHEGWRNAYRKQRDNQVNYVGSVGEPKGNQNCQLSYDEKTDCFQLRIRKDLEYMRDEKDKFFVIQDLQFRYHREELIRVLHENRTPLTFRIIRRGRKWYLQVIFTWTADDAKKISDRSLGVIGLDFNDGFISFSETDLYGNLKELRHFPLKHHGMGNRADSEIQEVIAGIVLLAAEKEKPIVIEDLNFRKTKAKTGKGRGKQGKQYQKMIHAFDYARYKNRMENACFRKNIGLIYVNPAYTSRIGAFL